MSEGSAMAANLTLYGRKTSANVQKAMWALEELGADYEQIEMGGKFGGLDTPAYRALNPNARVPTLKDGDFVLWESHAIIRYLAAKYGASTLAPTDLERRALADQWTDWTATRFQPAWIEVFWAVVRTRPADRDAARIARATEAANACFAIIDAQLARTPFLAGDTLTYADIAAGVSLYRWYDMEVDRQPFARVEDWHKRLRERPAFVTGVCVPYDDLVGR
jgi:glutathione S-transferase